MLEARHLGRRHPDGKRWLVEDVSLTLAAGDRLVVAGPSGSGKTLLLRCLALLDPLESGEVYWHGERVRHDRVPHYRREVIYLHQRAALLEHSVEQALRKPFALAVHRGRTFNPDRVLEWLAHLGRDRSFLAKATRDLSGGEIQITALVRAIQLDPTVLLLDEPTAGLDPQTTEAVQRLMDRWLAEAVDRRALVWVSHDASQTERMGTSVLHLSGGRRVDPA